MNAAARLGAVAMALWMMPVAGAVQLTAYGSGTHDLSSLRSQLVDDGYDVRNTAATPLFLGEIADPEGTVFMAMGIERPYGQRERAAIDSFMQRGGTVLVADNGGAVPNLLTGPYGVLFYGARLRDAAFEFNQSFVRMDVPTLGLQPLVADPTALLCRSEACTQGTMATSGEESFLDLNGNGVVDAGDDLGPFTMMVNIAVGRGRLVVLPTPAVATNDLVQDPANQEFPRALLAAVAPKARQVIFDESRHAVPDGEQAWVASLTVLGGFASVPVARLLLILVFAAGAVLVARRGRNEAPWEHRFDLARPVHEMRDDADLGPRLAELLRLKIKLQHQLVEPVSQDAYLQHAPSAQARDLLRDPAATNQATALRILEAEFPANPQHDDSHGGHAVQASNTPSPPTERPST